MKQSDPKISPKGLYLDPSAIECPPGALRVANNVCIRRPGLAEPRPGFANSPNEFDDITAVRRLIKFGDSLLAADVDNTETVWRGGTHVQQDDELAIDVTFAHSDEPMGVEARGSLYINSDPIRRIESEGAATAYRAGLPTAGVRHVSNPSSGSVLEEGKHVGYRAVIKYEDPNGLITRSGVSGLLVVSHSSSGTRNVTLRVLLHRGVTDYFLAKEVELYRTINYSVKNVPDVLYLAGTFEITSSDVTAGYIEYTDELPDEQLGQSLYTNPDQEGIEGNHIRPPKAGFLAEYEGSLFAGDIKHIAKGLFRYTSIGYDLTAHPSSTSLIGARVELGVGVTNGSADFNVADSSLYKVGQLVFTTSPLYLSPIVDIPDGTTLTTNDTWSGSTGTDDIVVYDSIKVNGEYFPAHTGQELCAFIRGDSDLLGSAGDPSEIVTCDLLSVTFSDPDSGGLLTEFTLEAANHGTASFEVWATNGHNYNPPLPEPTEANGYLVEEEAIPNGLAWSNREEPEHFQLVSGDRIGGPGRVQALYPVRNALLVAKEDGLYRVSGTEESGFRFDKVDSGVRILGRQCGCVLDDYAYIWARHGVFQCDEIQAVNLTQDTIRHTLTELGKYLESGSSFYGAWVSPHPTEKEILLGAPVLDGDRDVSERVYVFNANTRAWTTWFAGTGVVTHGIETADGEVVFSLLGATNFRDAATKEYTDNVTVLTIDSVDGTSVTYSAGSPSVGDLILEGSTYFLITDLPSAGVLTVDSEGLTAGARFMHAAFESEIQFVASTARNPGLLKNWGEGAIWFESLEGIHEYTIDWTSSLSGTTVSQTREVSTPRIDHSRAESYRFVVPVRHARCTHLFPTVKIKQGGAYWLLSGLQPGYLPMRDRVRQK